MSTENNICAPRLKFPGFTGEWEMKKLGEIIKLSKGSQVNGSELSKTSGYPMMNGGSTLSGYYSEYNNEANTIIISEGGNSCGYVNYMTERFWAGGHCYVVSILNDDVKEYVYQLLKAHESKIQALRVGSGLPNIQSKELLNYEVLFCSEKSEQKKIAECLAEMDKLISAQGENVDALKEKKKGLMQQLFPQNGETAPRLRFPGFEGEWEERKLEDITERVSVGLATSVTPYYREKGIVMFRNLNIKPNVLDDSDILYLDETFANANPSKKIHADDVLTVHTGYVGISCVVPAKYEGALTFTTLVTTTKKHILNPRFLCCYLNSSAGAKAVETLQAGAGRNNLNVNDFIMLRVPLPPTIAEQQKIADCLTALDEQIAAESAKLETLKDQKTGLMQQLFPHLAK